MVTQILGFAALATATDYVIDAIIPMPMPKPWNGKAIYVLAQWASIAMSLVAVAAAIVGFVTANPSFFCIAIAFLPFTLLAAYAIKNLSLRKTIEEDAAAIAVEKEKYDQLESKYKLDIEKLEKASSDLNKEADEKQESLDTLKEQLTQSQSLYTVAVESDRINLEKLQKLDSTLKSKMSDFSNELKEYAELSKQFPGLKDIADSLQKSAENIHGAQDAWEQLDTSVKALKDLLLEIIELDKKSDQTSKELSQEIESLKEKLDKLLPAYHEQIGKEISSSQKTRSDVADLLKDT